MPQLVGIAPFRPFCDARHRTGRRALLGYRLVNPAKEAAMAQSRKTKKSGKGAVELAETDLEQASAGSYFKGVDGLSVEQEVIEFQDGDDLILRKKK
jgi:hypothetical protein